MKIKYIFVLLGLVFPMLTFGQKPSLEVTSRKSIEGRDLIFTLKLIGAGAGFNVVVNSATQSFSATGSNQDYSDFSQALKLEQGKTTTVKIKTFQDQIIEGDEKFYLLVEQLGDSIDIPKSKVEAIILDQSIGMVSIDNQSAIEGDDLNFTLVLDTKTESPFIVKVDYIFPQGGLLTVNDFDSHTQFVLFNGDVGEKKSLIIHTYKDNVVDEGSEDIAITLAIVDSKFGGNLITGIGKGIINDFTLCRYCPATDFLNKAEQLTITVFGDGSLQKTVQNNQPIASNTAMGFYAVKHFKNLSGQKFGPWYRVELQASINIASSSDTLLLKNIADKVIVNDNVSQFGNSVLTPLNERQAFNIRIKLFNKKTLFGLISGYELRYTTSNRNWKLANDGLDPSDTSQVKGGVKQVNTNMLRVSAFHEFIPYDKRDDYSLMIRLGWAANWIGSDMALLKNDNLRSAFLGTKQTFFSGIEIGLGGRLKNINVDFGYVILPGGVEGLNGSRMVTTISFVGGVPIKIN